MSIQAYRATIVQREHAEVADSERLRAGAAVKVEACRSAGSSAVEVARQANLCLAGATGARKSTSLGETPATPSRCDVTQRRLPSSISHCLGILMVRSVVQHSLSPGRSRAPKDRLSADRLRLVQSLLLRGPDSDRWHKLPGQEAQSLPKEKCTSAKVLAF
jgi:hypothetical protein